MSGHPHSRSIAALVVGTVLLGSLVVVAVLGASGGALAAATDATGAGTAATDAADAEASSPTAQTEPALSITNASVAPDRSTTVELSLGTVPDGLSGFQVTLELAAADVAAFEGASYPERYGHTSTPSVAADGQSITVEAVDLHDEVTAGDADVPLATIEIAGDAEGEARVSAAALQIDADGGDEIQPAIDPGAVRVTADGSSNPSTAAASAVGATDGNGDATGAAGDATDGGDSAADASGRLDPLHLGAVGALVLASLLAVVAVRLRER